MARSRNADIGDNHVLLTDDDKAALSVFHSRQVRLAIAEADKLAAEAKAARKIVNNKFALVKGDLGYLRHQFEDLMADEDLSEAEFREQERQRTKRQSLHGLPVGTQLDMFSVGDTADDQGRAHADGRRACGRGDDRIPPDYIHATCIQSWMQGWDERQTEIVMQLGRAEAIIAAREEAAAEVDEDDDDQTDIEEFDPDAAAKALKRSGFTERGPVTADADMEAA